ncbi:hypothetical protein BC834DRAFT_845829 [Gloeopeniophorella convolvens]|nr:hypothetical protein BC834DRAFT_845829 [Gloeopeniophorella convolvens]
MQMASSGNLTALARQAFRAVHNPPNISTTSRGLHTQPAFVPRSTLQPTSFTSRALHRTKNLLNAFVGHLTTPGTMHVPGATSRTVHSAAHRIPTIENNLSLHVRHALSRPMGAPRLPRPPAVPRGIAQVGLGTARNFTTGRPIFQSIADNIYNVPVAARAFVEADWDTRTKQQPVPALKVRKEPSKQSKRAGPAPVCTKISFHPAASATTAAPAAPAEYDDYFALPCVPDVSATLLVPLAPTPTARAPLPLTPSYAQEQHPLLPFAELSALHIDHTRHSARVRALFEQLDAAQVWDHGATCDALGGARGAGVLRVHFAGWSAHAVRGVLGEAATGWCVLEEQRADDGFASEAGDDFLSELGSGPDESGLGALDLGAPLDPAYSFVLPTLDFSASSGFVDAGSPDARTPPSERELASHVSLSDSDMFSDGGYASDGISSDGSGFRSWLEPPDALYASAAGSRTSTPSWAGLSFSSAFSQRMAESPHAELF